jgi:fimbrial chaperone protein
LRLVDTFFGLLLLVFCLTGQARAEAVLFIYPTLVIFENGVRSAEVTIANRGDETGTFETSWSDLIMTEDGRLARTEGDNPWSIRPHVRYSPRRVTLAPAETQVVKIALRALSDVPEGEYYSHLRVLTINSEDPEAVEEETEKEEPSAGIVINARTAIAIPVVWRNSLLEPRAGIEGVTLNHESREISVAVRREGLLSVRGFVHVVDPSNGEFRALAEPAPLVIYPSVETRTVTTMLGEGLDAMDIPENALVLYSPDLELSETSPLIASHPLAR